MNHYNNDISNDNDTSDEDYAEEQLPYLLDKLQKCSSGQIYNILAQNKELALILIQQDAYALGNLHPNLKGDFDFVSEAIKVNPKSIAHCNHKLKYHPQLLQIYVDTCASRHKLISECFYPFYHDGNNLNLMSYFVQYDGLVLQYVDDKLKNNYELVLKAVTQNGLALKYAYASLKKDYKIVLTAVQKNGLALEDADVELQDDAEIVKEAVQNNPRALEYASAARRKDRVLVSMVVQQDGYALQYADDALKDNIHIVRLAVNQWRGAIHYASKRIVDNPHLLVGLVTKAAKR